MTGNLTKFNIVGNKKILVSRYFEIESDRMNLFGSLYSQDVLKEKPLETILFEDVIQIKGTKRVQNGYFVWRLYILLKVEGIKCENLLSLNNGNFCRIIEIEFASDAVKESFLLRCNRR